MKGPSLVPLAILALAGGLIYMAYRRHTKPAGGEGDAMGTASGFDALFDSIFGPGTIAAPAPAPAPAPSTPVDNGANPSDGP